MIQFVGGVRPFIYARPCVPLLVLDSALRRVILWWSQDFGIQAGRFRVVAIVAAWSIRHTVPRVSFTISRCTVGNVCQRLIGNESVYGDCILEARRRKRGE